MIFTPYGDPEPSVENLAPTRFFDFETPSVQAFVERVIDDETNEIKKAVRLFYAIRDEFRYDIFGIRMTPDIYVASDVIAKGSAFCIPKASLLVATARAAGIPAVIGLSDVINHFTSPKVERAMAGKTVFLHHGYAVMYLEGKWVKAVPAFNKELCDKTGVAPTEFDGRNHAILQEYDADNNTRMEYLKDHGYWSELPFSRIDEDFRNYYPKSFFGEAPIPT